MWLNSMTNALYIFTLLLKSQCLQKPVYLFPHPLAVKNIVVSISFELNKGGSSFPGINKFVGVFGGNNIIDRPIKGQQWNFNLLCIFLGSERMPEQQTHRQKRQTLLSHRLYATEWGNQYYGFGVLFREAR
jgi:hypothetical protein